MLKKTMMLCLILFLVACGAEGVSRPDSTEQGRPSSNASAGENQEVNV